MLYSNFPLAIYFAYGTVYDTILRSLFFSPSPPPRCVHKPVLYLCLCCVLCAVFSHFSRVLQVTYRKELSITAHTEEDVHCILYKKSLGASLEAQW